MGARSGSPPPPEPAAEAPVPAASGPLHPGAVAALAPARRVQLVLTGEGTTGSWVKVA